MQIFLPNPQDWRKPAPRGDAADLHNSPLPLYVHAPYLINVCSPRPNVRWVRSLEMLKSEVPLYIENTAGGENAVARRFDDLAHLWEAPLGDEIGRGRPMRTRKRSLIERLSQERVSTKALPPARNSKPFERRPNMPPQAC